MRQYVILNATEANAIDFSEVLETSFETLLKSNFPTGQSLNDLGVWVNPSNDPSIN